MGWPGWSLEQPDSVQDHAANPDRSDQTGPAIGCRPLQQLSAEITELDRYLQRLVAAAAPRLLALKGVGTDIAAALLLAAGDNPQRLRSEAPFARLCGVAPIPASSGKTSRRRLSRGGNRDTNRALYMLAVSRLRWDPRTRAYVARRTREGKTTPEIRRCLIGGVSAVRPTTRSSLRLPQVPELRTSGRRDEPHGQGLGEALEAERLGDPDRGKVGLQRAVLHHAPAREPMSGHRADHGLAVAAAAIVGVGHDPDLEQPIPPPLQHPGSNKHLALKAAEHRWPSRVDTAVLPGHRTTGGGQPLQLGQVLVAQQPRSHRGRESKVAGIGIAEPGRPDDLVDRRPKDLAQQNDVEHRCWWPLLDRLATGSYQSAGTASTHAGGRNTTVAPRKLASSGPLLTTDVRGCASWTSLQPRCAVQKATTACRLTVVVMSCSSWQKQPQHD